ncbi:MAG TPA: polysaccharide lyase [Candidatus Paceibacterota bacterium]|nr:polysaccharide lyase [Candidatus Paceibacterota bacterium]
MKYFLPLILLAIPLSIYFLRSSPAIEKPPASTDSPSLRTFASSFETVEDFKPFYIVPPNHMDTASHEQSRERVRSGTYAHKGWIYGENPVSGFKNNNHRAYPTIQFQKTAQGILRGPIEATFWVWVDAELKPRRPENDWLSLATFTSDPSDEWKRTVLVNLSHDGLVHLMHVPDQGKAEYLYQNTELKFPQRRWVKLRVYLDSDPENGYAKVWQDGVLVSHAKVRGGNGTLAQAHFGLYAPPWLSSGTVYNDDLVIREVRGE